MTNEEAPTFRTIPVSLTAEQFAHVSDLALVLDLLDDELVQMATVAKIEEMFAGLENIKRQLAEPDEDDSDARLQHLGALAANREARCALDPEYKAQLEETETEIARAQKEEYFF